MQMWSRITPESGLGEACRLHRVVYNLHCVASRYRGTSLISTPPPQDHHRSLGIGLLYGPTGGGCFLCARYPSRSSSNLSFPLYRAILAADYNIRERDGPAGWLCPPVGYTALWGGYGL